MRAAVSAGAVMAAIWLVLGTIDCLLDGGPLLERVPYILLAGGLGAVHGTLHAMLRSRTLRILGEPRGASGELDVRLVAWAVPSAICAGATLLVATVTVLVAFQPVGHIGYLVLILGSIVLPTSLATSTLFELLAGPPGTCSTSGSSRSRCRPEASRKHDRGTA